MQKRFGIALPIFHGRWGTPIPYQNPVIALIGEPIATPIPQKRGARPPDALVDEYHAKYVRALEELYSKHIKDRKLVIR